MSDEGKKRTPAEVERDVVDEVSFHIEASVRDLMRTGLGPAEARAEALRRFGNVSGVEDRLRTIGRRRARRRRLRRWLDGAGQDVRFALRNLRRHPLFGLSMVAILGLGVAVNAAVFRVIDGALLRPLPFADGDRVVRVFAGDTFDERVNMSVPEFRDWVSEVDVAESSVAAYQSGRTLLRSDAEPAAVSVGVIEGDIAGVLGLRPAIGRAITPEEIGAGARVAMLDEAAWRTRYDGSPDVLGETLSFPGESYTIVGVLPSAARTAMQMGELEAWIPLVEAAWMVRGTHFIRVASRLRQGQTLAAARSSVDAAMQSLIDGGVTDHGMQLVGVREQAVAASRPALFVLAGAVTLVLLIVCANLTNLFHAHALGRSGEFAVRASLGAGRGRLARQVMTEGAVVGVVGGVLGLLLSRTLTGTVAAATGGAARLTATGLTDLRIAGFSLAVALVSGALIGAWPAVRSGGSLAGSLKEGMRATGNRSSWRRRRWLVGTEVALSVVLVAGAALMVRSVSKLIDRDPGFEAEGVLSLDVLLPATRYDEDASARFYVDLMAAIRRLPGVTAAGAISHLPLGGSDTNGSFSIPGREFPEDQRPHTKKRVVTPGFFEAMRIPVVAGRLPVDADRAGAPEVAVVSESLARRYWPDGDAVGQRVSFSWGPPGEQEVIAVVGDILHDGLDTEPGPTLYRTHSHFSMEAMSVMVRTEGDPLSLVAPIRRTIGTLDPELPLTNVQTMESVVAISIGDRGRLMRLLAGFAGIALLLAALGVYAVASQGVEQRRREIGVRIAVGADARDVVGMVAKQELLAVVLGLVAGIAGALAATGILEASLFGVSARDPLALTAAAVLLGLAAAFAVMLPASRAARTEPASVLREG